MHTKKTASVKTVHECKVPADFQRALTKNAKALSMWKDITPLSRRDFITWIESAKQAETRARRIVVACDKLVSGKRRPCCYSVVPMHLYTALNKNSGAKKAWGQLTPDARRDIANAVDAIQNTVERERHIEQVCTRLAKTMT